MGVVHRGVGGCLASESCLIDEAKGVERLAFVRVIDILDAAEVRCEQFLVLRDVGLSDHVLDGRLYRLGGHGVDSPESKSEEAIAAVLLELRGQRVGQLDGLIFDHEATDSHVVSAYGTGSGGRVAVGNLPGRTGLLECGRFRGIEDGVGRAST